MRRVLASVALLLAANPAHACGGFFCDQSLPVVQSAERILFAVDPSAHTVTTEVTISYEGPSESFSWVLPVPGEPELFTASEGLFDALALRTQPSYAFDYVYDGDCIVPIYDYSAASTVTDTDSAGGGVEILDSQEVGPYDTVTLAADSSEALLAWLAENGFDVPPDLDPKLAPYVAGGMNFVALKLHKGNDTGDIVPIGLTYAGDEASIPIQLTAVAAKPGMRLEVYVFGDSRAVPESYLHVVPNDLAVDWFDGTVSYDEVVSMAADEAGGQAFATDFSGSTAPLRGTFYQEGMIDLAAMRAADGAVSWMDALIYTSNLPITNELVEVLRDWLPLPPELAAQGVTETQWWNCLSCYPDFSGTMPFDAVAATDDLEARLVQPMRDAEDLFARYDHLTRLTSSLDAVEMTVDPVFTFNADMEQDYSNAHVATLTYHCPTQIDTWEAERTVAFPGGYVVELPSEADLAAQGISEYEYMASLAAISALQIESTSSSGDPDPLYDGRDDLQALVDALNGGPRGIFFDKAGCGCDTGGTAGSAGGLLLLAGLVARRRRS